MTTTPHPRTYVAVIDDTPESRTALRFAARRAARTGGTVLLLTVAPTPEFSQWGGVQAAMEQEAQERAQGLLAQVAGEMLEEAGIRPSIISRSGDPVEAVKALLAEETWVDALVLGAAARGGPGPLVSYFAGEAAGDLRCPVMIIPGGLDDEALDRLS
jgi:nucleotide-binding universal stress UspA family protein